MRPCRRTEEREFERNGYTVDTLESLEAERESELDYAAAVGEAPDWARMTDIYEREEEAQAAFDEENWEDEAW